ncbi:hypothetical protein LTR36_006803 [Oleoguttula mirabilis]|uniref:Uncharacterized protein n=1 Tax=Oleoguttula mirabilis TaxID=1507867 RepID=A0AAV9JB01_9PEZI|nr:hypothetical protein LTR36_006803 [Oleoguttula mirabilis]
MSSAAAQQPKFPWDYSSIPDTAFWNSLDGQVAQTFLSCYSEPEISQLVYIDSLAPTDEKLRHLQSVLTQTLEARTRDAAPASLCDIDHASWRNLKTALASIEHARGNLEAAETLTREWYDNGPTKGGKDMSALLALSGLLEEMDRHTEAEAAAREFLPWIQGHALLGSRESPQALGCMRLLATSVWKQSRCGEAEDWIVACRTAVEGMGTGKFAKYQDDERRQLESDVEDLKEWRRRHEAQ